MSKIKAHYHEEICNGQAGPDKEYAVKCMKAVTDATNDWLAGQLSTANWYKVILDNTTEFQNMHDPCQPQ
jgi:hypothetical protein